MERYRELMKDKRNLELALAIVEEQPGEGEAEARTRWLVLSFIKDVAMRCSLFVDLPKEALPAVATRFYRIFLSLFQWRCQHGTNAAKQHFQIFGEVIALLGQHLRAQPTLAVEWGEPGFQLMSSENMPDVIYGLELLEIMFGVGSHGFVHLYLQRVAVLLRRCSGDVSASLPVFMRVLETWLKYVHFYPKVYASDESHIVLETVLHVIGLLSVAFEQHKVIADEGLLTVIHQAACLLKFLILYLYQDTRDSECNTLFQAVLAQSIDVLVRAANVVSATVPGKYSRDLLSVLLFILWNKLPSEVIEGALPQLCKAALELCILCEDDLEDRQVNPVQFYDTAYPSGGAVCPVTDGHPRRVAMEFLRWLARYQMRGVLDMILSMPPEENVIYALRVLGKELKKLEGPGSAECQQAVAQYLLRNVRWGAQLTIFACTGISAISRFVYCLPRDSVNSLAESALQLVCAYAPGQQNEDICFFTVGCDVLYHLMKLPGFVIANRACMDVIAHGSEFTANGVGIKLLNTLDIGAELQSLMTRLIISLSHLIDDDADDDSENDASRIEAIFDLLGDKAQAPIQLPTELLCQLYRDRLCGDFCDHLLYLAQYLFRNEHTPNLYMLLNVILEMLNGDNSLCRFCVYGTELGLAFCSFITHQLRCAPADLVGRLFETLILLVRSAQFPEDFTALIRVFAAMFQASVVEARVLGDVMNIITQSQFREQCGIVILEIWASASAVYKDIRMPPDMLKLFVQAISENKFSTTYLRRLSVICLENHRDCWIAELGSLDEILAVVRMAPVWDDPDEPDMPLSCNE